MKNVSQLHRPNFRSIAQVRIGINYMSTVQHTIPGHSRLCVFTIATGKTETIYLTDVLDDQIGHLKDRALLQFLIDNLNRATVIHQCEHG